MYINKINMTYAIFTVYDYKGGELSSRTNLSKESFISELAQQFENFVDFGDIVEKRDKRIDAILDITDYESELKMIKDELTKAMNDEDFYSTYAYSDNGSFCGELYKVDGDKMIEVDFSDFIDGIAQYYQKKVFKN